MKTSLLISGALGYSLLQYLHNIIDIQFIATDAKSTAIIEYAMLYNIPMFTGNPRQGKLYKFARTFDNDILFSINYLFIIEEDVIELFKYPINFHGSLLPKYRGRTPHVWAIINNESKTGVTAHIIDKECDTGDIILQIPIHIDVNDTGSTLLKKYETIYPEMVKILIERLKSGSIDREPQQHSKATYFGKRTAMDGEINWNWQKERIRNWVRAQASPYPGAFSFLDGQKIIIDKVEYSEEGFDYLITNGSILKSDSIVIVKTPNGALELNGIREGKEHCIKGKIFGNDNR